MSEARTFREEEHELIDACRIGHGTMYDQDDLGDVVAGLASECENREANERAEIRRAERLADALRDALRFVSVGGPLRVADRKELISMLRAALAVAGDEPREDAR